MKATDESGKTAVLKCAVQGKNPILFPTEGVNSEGGGGGSLKSNFLEQAMKLN